MWRTYYLNDESIKHMCESPDQLRVPVGSCVHVREGMGHKMGRLWYRAIPSYITVENIDQLKMLCVGLKGWALEISEPLEPKEWRRGWVDEYYPQSSSPIFKCIMPGMVRVQLKLIDTALAKLDTTTVIPACPTCTLEQYEDKDSRGVFDKAMSNFIYMWVYGRPQDSEGERYSD